MSEVYIGNAEFIERAKIKYLPLLTYLLRGTTALTGTSRR
jgi:hypothetical protein